MHEPYTGKELKRGIPILRSTPAGNIIEKKVTHYRVKCPECFVEARYTHDSEPVCPNCGLIVAGKHGEKEQIVRDPKAAGRPTSTDEVA